MLDFLIAIDDIVMFEIEYIFSKTLLLASTLLLLTRSAKLLPTTSSVNFEVADS